MNREIELKYTFIEPMDAKSLFKTPLISQYLVGKPVLIEMYTTYFDTEHEFLTKCGCTLRQRRENGKNVFAFKYGRRSKGALSKKKEIEVTAKNLISAIPLLIEAGAAEHLLKLSLEFGICEMAYVSFSRYSANLKITPKFIVELVHDSGFFINGDKKRKFSEIEIELVKGRIYELSDFGDLLENTIPIRPEKYSKIARALSL